MKTFQNIHEFIVATFPQEHDKIIKQRKTSIEEAIENIDKNFDKELERIMKGEEEKKK
jgi:predicted component of type VI protein secretion system